MLLARAQRRQAALLAGAVGRAVRLAEAALTDGRQWRQVAAEGEYKGFRRGTLTLTLDRAALDQLVANFRAHPSYEADAAGVGKSDVIPFDYDHASEIMAPAEKALNGCPACAWAQELEVRAGADGKGELWALVRYLDQAKKYAAEGSYQWTSIAATDDYVDPVSGKHVGWALTSIAFTNGPFIQGMEPAARIAASVYEWEAREVKTPADCVAFMRKLFELPATSGVPELRAELAKLAGYMAQPTTAPAGIDLDCIVGSLRVALSLPLLADATAVLTGAEAVLASVEAAAAAAAAAQPPTAPTSPMPAAPAPEMSTMSLDPKKIILSKIAKVLGTQVQPYASEEDLEREILADLENAAKARDTFAKLQKELGFEGPDGIGKAIADFEGKLKRLQALAPAIEGMAAALAEEEDKKVDEDVEKVMNALGCAKGHPLHATLARSFVLERTGGANVGADGKSTLAALKGKPEQAQAIMARETHRKAFLANHPELQATQAVQAPVHLTQPIATPRRVPPAQLLAAGQVPQFALGQGGQVVMSRPSLPALAAAAQGQPIHGTDAPGPAQSQDPDLAINLANCAGENWVRMAMNHVKAAPGGATLSHDAVHDRAVEIVRKQRAAGLISGARPGAAA